ncbi:hypothetical protein ACJRO7_001696 [Eucalyptus globulus]|uniref:Late embryogenesis abundant protein LEA-2 subgroup domain-containing protein n=1 Tax=Eucalyptus globulus TaxID=34317 RepID=A0ABD3M1Q9_EUCGL
MTRGRLKICCFNSAVLLAILTIIIITVQSISLVSMLFNVTTLSMLVTIDNPNYGSFEYKSTMDYVNYNGSTVPEVPMAQNKIPARGKVNVTTSTDLITDKLISNPIHVAKIFKYHATTYSTCSILFHIQSQAVDSKCNTRIKL